MLFKHHHRVEKNVLLMAVLTLIVVAIGGIVEIVPLFTIETTIERVEGVRPYSPLELAGRNVYIREGCYVCHSQQVRPFRDEVERYGHYSLAAESMYDHPFQWGSKRTGPDLARVGGKYSNEWHALHLADPGEIVPGSVMPAYAFLASRPVDGTSIARHLTANRSVGVPYSEQMVREARHDLAAQADPGGDPSELLARYPGAKVVDTAAVPGKPTEMDALIAYLQVLGTQVKFRNVLPQDLRQ